jgi:uncharacterized protein with gpF-like domain
MKQAANQALSALINRGLEGGLAVVEEIRKGLARFTRTADSWQDYLPKARRWVAAHEPILARVLSDSLLAGWLQGGRRAVRGLPRPTGLLPPVLPPPLPPAFLEPTPDFPQPIIRFPMIERAAQDLVDREVMDRAAFDALALEARQAAFTVARVSSLDTLEKIQEGLVYAVARGETLRDFRRRVEPILEETPLSPGHLENVFRTNISTAYSTGMATLLQHPLVADEFPYLLYTAIHDSRTEDTHLEMEHLGIQRTAVYRRDDPIWEKFFPPWRWN